MQSKAACRIGTNVACCKHGHVELVQDKLCEVFGHCRFSARTDQTRQMDGHHGSSLLSDFFSERAAQAVQVN